jgi:hypothetical protein
MYDPSVCVGFELLAADFASQGYKFSSHVDPRNATCLLYTKS